MINSVGENSIIFQIVMVLTKCCNKFKKEADQTPLNLIVISHDPKIYRLGGISNLILV
jgi:hypothetical protein